MKRSARRLAGWLVDQSSTSELAPGTKSPLRLYLGDRPWEAVALVVTSLVAGFAEAGMIYFLVQIATTIADEALAVGVDIGPLSNEMSVGLTFVFAGTALALSTVFGLLATVLVARITTSFLARLRKHTMQAYLAAGWATQSLERPGRLQDLLSNTVNRLSQGLLAGSVGLSSALSFIAMLISALVVQPLAALCLLAAVAVVGVVLLPLSRLTKRWATRQHRSHLDYATTVAETVTMTREIAAFGRGDVVRQQVARHADGVARTAMVARLLVRGNPIVYQAAVLTMLLGGMAFVYAGDASGAADLGAIVILLVRALTYVQTINAAAQQVNEMRPFLDDIRDQVAKYERSTPDHGDEVLRSVDTIEARSLSFAYDSGSERLVLDDVSFAIAHGDALGIVGPSGSGKTTLIQIILRLRTPDRGELLVNGAEARRFSASSWTERVSFVPQDNHLLRGTVAENIAFFRDLDAATIERAARRAHLHEDVLKLPNGYDSLIGPGHADLSGGQRQRLGLARALACDPDLLVLDEPTSALDMRSESLIQETLDELAAEVTMVIVAHRMSTLARCSHILVLQDGRATAFGTPEEVSASSAFYREAIAMTSSGTMADRSPAPSPRAARRGAPLRPSSP